MNKENMICTKTNTEIDLSKCAYLCTKKCDLISAGNGREIGKMLKDITKHCCKRYKLNRPFEDRRKK